MEEQEKQAMVVSLRLLAASPKSRRMLAAKLEEKGFSREIIDKVLKRLATQRLLNDEALAQSFFQTLTTQRISGRRRIAFELERRGIEGRVIEEILEQYSPAEERERALEVARQKRERWKKLEPMKRRKRTYDFLVRRGFDFALSREIVAELEKEGF